MLQFLAASLKGGLKTLKALEAVHDRGRGHGTGEAITAVVPKGNPRHKSHTHIVELPVTEGHRIEPERCQSAVGLKLAPKTGTSKARPLNWQVRCSFW